MKMSGNVYLKNGQEKAHYIFGTVLNSGWTYYCDLLCDVTLNHYCLCTAYTLP